MTGANSERSDRADRMLVVLGHFESRAAARAAIEAGRVRVEGEIVRKPSQTISAGALIDAEPAHPYVSRGALKLAHALDVFGVDPQGLVCLDIGASTGGFTDVLLRRGAAHVTAVDVGRDQLRDAIALDARVRSLEALDARLLTSDHLTNGHPQLIVCDASFIGLEKVLGPPLSLAAPDAVLVALFKPQFQVGREHVGKGGLVTDAGAVDAAATALTEWLGSQRWQIGEWTDSPIKGGDGNAERLFVARRR